MPNGAILKIKCKKQYYFMFVVKAAFTWANKVTEACKFAYLFAK